VKSFQTYIDLPSKAKGAVIALGNFDGLHRGHQAVIAQAKEIADSLGAPLGIGLFRPHPRRFFKPDSEPFRLMSAQVRAAIMPTLGVDVLYEIPFDETLRDMDDTEFVETVLHKGLAIKHVVVGQDFGFGKDRCGNVESLTQLCAERGIDVTPITEIGLHKFYGKYGSTEIRAALKQGDVFHAAHMLSRPWTVDGKVIKGQQLGRTLGYPTANLTFGDLVLPKFGVYAVEARLHGEDKWRPGVASVGTRPTVGGEGVLLETYIFDFDQDIYGQRLEVRFRTFIRGEEKFDSVEEMKVQIDKDANGARAIFGILD